VFVNAVQPDLIGCPPPHRLNRGLPNSDGARSSRVEATPRRHSGDVGSDFSLRRHYISARTEPIAKRG
jgi:hypothetical protein